MTTLTINVNPAEYDGHFLSVKLGRPLAAQSVEVSTAQDCVNAVDSVAASAQGAYPHGVQVSAFIRQGAGRKPNGYKGLKLDRFIPASAPAGGAA